MNSFIIISLSFCSIFISLSQSVPNTRNDPCLTLDDCETCIALKGCALWYCPTSDRLDNNHTLCQNTQSSRPKTVCSSGKWHKLQSSSTCASITTGTNVSSNTSGSESPEVKTNKKDIGINDDTCLQIQDCNECKGQCAFWYCRDPDGHEANNQTQCESTHSARPKTECKLGRWRKLMDPDTCSSIEPTTTTTSHSPNMNGSDVTTNIVNKKQEIGVTDDTCLLIKDCNECKSQCAFWYCRDADGHETNGQTQCESTHSSRPKTECKLGKWRRLESPDTCDSILPTTTTTTTTATTTSNTSDTTTSKSKTTTKSTISPTSPKPHEDTDRKLTGWTITGIVISSLIVILVLVGVAYKKVMKIYRARNPYRTLNE